MAIEDFEQIAEDLLPWAHEVGRTSRLQTIDELQARPHPGWLVHSLVPAVGVGRLVGSPATGKTYVGFDLAKRVVRDNRLWFGHDVDRHGDVVYCMMESLFDAPNRSLAWDLAHPKHPPVPGRDLYILPEEALDLADDDSLGTLALDIQLRSLEPALVVFDTQALATPGTDENDNTAMGEVIKRLKRFANSYKTCVLLVHHPTLGTTRARGAGSATAALDFEIEIVAGTLKVTKNKYGPKPDAFAFELREVPLGILDAKGREITSCWGAPSNKTALSRARDAVVRADFDSREADVREYLREHPGASHSAVCQGVYGNKNPRSRAKLDRLAGRVYEAVQVGKTTRLWLIEEGAEVGA